MQGASKVKTMIDTTCVAEEDSSGSLRGRMTGRRRKDGGRQNQATKKAQNLII